MTGSGPDFLASIAAKTVGAAPLVEPRLPSRFEARPGHAEGFARAWEETVEVEAVPRGPGPPRRRAVAEAAEDPEPAGREAVETGERPRPRRRRRPERADVPVAAVEPRPSAPAPPALIVQLPPASERAEPLPVAREAPRPLLVVPPRPASLDDRERVAPRPRIESSAPAEREPDRAERPVPEAAVLEAAVPHRVELPVPAPRARAPAADRAIRMPEVRPRPTRSELRVAEPARPARPAVVNITIGRIEVRAPTAGAAPPARSAQPPRPAPQSLAEYLKRRGGGR